MPFETDEGGAGGGVGGTGAGGAAQSVPISGTRDPFLLTDVMSMFASVDFSSTDDEGAFGQRSTTNTTTLFWTGGNALKHTITAAGNIERQLLFGGVRLMKGTRTIFRIKVFTDDNVPAISVGLFNNNAGTALLSSSTDAIYFNKAVNSFTTTCVYEWNNNGVQSAAAGHSTYGSRFQDLSIQIDMDDETAGAGVIYFRIDGNIVKVVACDASTAALTIPYDETLYPTYIVSGTSITGFMGMKCVQTAPMRDYN